MSGEGIRASQEAARRFADHILEGLDADELYASDGKRLALFAYLFGGAHGAATRQALSPPEAHAVALSTFQKVFEMTPSESAGVVQWCIDQTAPSAPMASAVHAGLEAFLQWNADPNFEPAALLADLIAAN